MNRPAREHLTRAQGYVAKGEGFYHRAATEIIAAQEADPTLGYAEIGKMFGRSKEWPRRLVTWHTSGTAPSPFSEPNREPTDVRGAQRVLRQAPMEQVEQIIGSLPKSRQKAIAAAAGHEYLKARQELEDDDRRLTPDERRALERTGENLGRGVRQAVGGFAALGIVGHLEQATEELQELNADASLTPDAAKKIARALDAFVTEFDFARALLGEEKE